MRPAFIFLLLLFFLSTTARAEEPLLGLWMTAERDAVVEFYTCEEAFCGRFYWLKDDSAAAPSLDERNPDPEKKKRPLCGLTFLGGFEPSDDGALYEGGWLYSPRHGATYSAQLHRHENGTLDVRGYMFFSFLGGGQTWTRIASHTSCLEGATSEE